MKREFPNKSVRLLKLMKILNTKSWRSSEYIAEILGVSRRTVKRYIRELEEMGVPITSSRDGYKVIESELSERARRLLKERVSLIELLAVAKFLKGKDEDESLSMADFVELKRRVDESLIIENKSLMDERDLTILKASIDRNRIEIEHRKAESGEITRRKVDPLALYLRDGKWYLIAFCHLRQELRMFRNSNIKSVKVLPEKFDPYMYMVDVEKFVSEFRVLPTRKKPESVVLETERWVADYLKETPILPSMKVKVEGSKTYVILKIRDPESLIPWIFGMGKSVKIISPQWLKKRAVEMAQRFIDSLRS